MSLLELRSAESHLGLSSHKGFRWGEACCSPRSLRVFSFAYNSFLSSYEGVCNNQSSQKYLIVNRRVYNSVGRIRRLLENTKQFSSCDVMLRRFPCPMGIARV